MVHNTDHKLLLAIVTAASLVLVGCAGNPAESPMQNQVQIQKRQAVQAEPLSPEQQVRMQAAEAAIHGEKWSRAQALLEPLLAERNDVAEIHANLAWVTQQQGKRSRAMSLYRQAFELDPNDAASANNLALLLRENGRFQEAVDVLEEGIEYAPNTAELHYNLAVIAELYLLDLQTALAHYKVYRNLAAQEGQAVAGWIADLERRLN